MKTANTFLNRPFNQHLLFWLLVLACYLISNWEDFYHPGGLFATYTIRVGLQIFTAYTCLLVILPRYLAQKKILETTLSLLLVVFAGHALSTLAGALLLEPRYPEAFAGCISAYSAMSTLERIFDPKSILFISPANLFPPAFVLIALQHYRKQQQISELNEQKKAAELSALKNQLNPHFLFNTLNNLYTLALKKSDQTAVAISKLSDILDHILYRCNGKFVALDREMELLRSYVALEKIRYGGRVRVNWNTQLEGNQRIAPLLLLTFIENAFKHGVSQEINRASIDISLSSTEHEIAFRVRNTVPANQAQTDARRDAIGLVNIRKQLELIYPDRHRLAISHTPGRYELALDLRTP